MNEIRMAVMNHPLLSVIVAGTVIRLVLAGFSQCYDVDYWALAIRNMRAGEGLYGLEGYFYSPVWGYVLGLSSAVQSLFLDTGEISLRVPEFLFTENIPGFRLSATISSPAFNYLVKFPLIISDIILTLLVYRLSERFLGKEKAARAAAMVFLCPIIIGVVSFNGMPDTISAVFAVLTILLILEDRPFMAGMTFSIAVWTKFFPAFMIFCLVSYLYTRYRGEFAGRLLRSVLGFGVMSLIVFLPMILDGDVMRAFQFISDRSSAPSNGNILGLIEFSSRVLLYIGIFAGSVLLGYFLHKSGKEDLDRKLVVYCFGAALLCMLYPPAPQYLVLMMSFLAFMAACDRKFVLPWAVLSVSAIVFLTPLNADMALPVAVWTDFMSTDTLLSVFTAYQTRIGPLTLMELQYYAGGVIQYAGILLTAFALIRKRDKTAAGIPE